jgi:hypothetical protein
MQPSGAAGTKGGADWPFVTFREYPSVVDPLAVYASLFAASFLAATVFPVQSELILMGLVANGGFPWWALLIVATAGNTLGAIVYWLLGRFFLRFLERRWFPVSRQTYDKVERWFTRFRLTDPGWLNAESDSGPGDCAGTSALRSAMPRWTSTAQRKASTTLANSARSPSPVIFTIRPRCSSILESTMSRRCAFSQARVPSSSAPISRL